MAFPYKKMTEADFERIREITAPERVTVGADIPEDYFHDEMPEYGVFPPELYVEVLNKEEISAIMAYAYGENIPVTCRGAGTGLAGGATCKYGGIMLSVMRMNRIDPIDFKNQTITAQPGALLQDVQAAAAAGGLFYPPDPGEKTASIGGNVSTNAGGMKAVRYGLTRDFVRCVEAVLPDGSIMEFSSNVVKNTTGYDVKDLVIGSEGTLCILTSVTLKLLPRPNFSATLVMPFPSVEECADMVPKILALPYVPTAIEFLEQELLEIVERTMEKSLPVKDGEALLIVMYDAATRDELDQSVHMAAREALRSGALDCYVADTAERAAAVWAVRGSILEAEAGLRLPGGVRRGGPPVPDRRLCQAGQGHRPEAWSAGGALRSLRGRQHPHGAPPGPGAERRGVAHRHPGRPDRALRPGQIPGRADVRGARHRQRPSGLPEGLCGGTDDLPV